MHDDRPFELPRRHVHDVASLLQYAPRSAVELSAWLDAVTHEQADTVWVAALIALSTEDDPTFKPKELLAVLTVMRRRYREACAAGGVSPSVVVPRTITLRAEPVRPVHLRTDAPRPAKGTALRSAAERMLEHLPHQGAAVRLAKVVSSTPYIRPLKAIIQRHPHTFSLSRQATSGVKGLGPLVVTRISEKLPTINDLFPEQPMHTCPAPRGA